MQTWRELLEGRCLRAGEMAEELFIPLKPFTYKDKERDVTTGGNLKECSMRNKRHHKLQLPLKIYR